jgi:hypothetical protein
MFNQQAEKVRIYMYIGVLVAVLLIFGLYLLSQYVFVTPIPDDGGKFLRASANSAEKFNKRLTTEFLDEAKFQKLEDLSVRPKSLSELKLGQDNPFASASNE